MFPTTATIRKASSLPNLLGDADNLKFVKGTFYMEKLQIDQQAMHNFEIHQWHTSIAKGSALTATDIKMDQKLL